MGIIDTVKLVIGLAAPDAEGAFTAPTAAMPRDLEHQHHQALMDSAREQLRAAHVERASAKGALAEAEGRVARALEVIATSQRLDAAAAEAEAVARTAAREWVAAGSPPESRPDPALLDRAAAASNAAIDARTVAGGASDALPALQRAVQDAKLALGQAEGRVRDAAVNVLAAAAEPKLAELERLREQYEETLRPLAALRHLVRHRGPAAELSGFSSTDIGQALDKRFKELTPLPPAEPDLRGTALELRERALRLLDDPQARLEI
jgi:hypothetical protein